jgi:capsular exopolysaccharide synthesis family protein
VNAPSSRQASGGSAFDESRVDVPRYLAALRRSRPLIACIVVGVTGIVLLASLLLPNTYRATATILLDVQAGALGTEDAESTQRRLATANSLLLSTEVLRRAAEEVPEETADSIANDVESTVDPSANLIDIVASDQDPETAAAIANAIAQAFLDVQQEREQQRFEVAAESIRQQISTLQGDPAATEQVAALRQRLAELEVAGSTAGVDFALAEEARVPTDPASPRPLRNTVLAFFASLFLGVLVALGRDQLRPQINEPRELAQALGLPVLAGIPFVGRRLGRRRHIAAAVEHEAYRTLRAGIEREMPPDSQSIILITSALHGEGKTTVTARLGRALAVAGHRTLLISADLRWPALHNVFDVELAPGLSDALALTERAGVNQRVVRATARGIELPGAEAINARLEILPSGRKTTDPARLLSSAAATAFFDNVRGLGYDYILVDAPPMLGIADVQGLVKHADRVLVVSRLDRLSADSVIDVRELLERLDVNPLGLVVIGARVEVSPYYLTERPSLFRGASASEEEGLEARFRSPQ